MKLVITRNDGAVVDAWGTVDIGVFSAGFFDDDFEWCDVPGFEVIVEGKFANSLGDVDMGEVVPNSTLALSFAEHFNKGFGGGALSFVTKDAAVKYLALSNVANGTDMDFFGGVKVRIGMITSMPFRCGPSLECHGLGGDACDDFSVFFDGEQSAYKGDATDEILRAVDRVNNEFLRGILGTLAEFFGVDWKVWKSYCRDASNFLFDG